MRTLQCVAAQKFAPVFIKTAQLTIADDASNPPNLFVRIHTRHYGHRKNEMGQRGYKTAVCIEEESKDPNFENEYRSKRK